MLRALWELIDWNKLKFITLVLCIVVGVVGIMLVLVVAIVQCAISGCTESQREFAGIMIVLVWAIALIWGLTGEY